MSYFNTGTPWSESDDRDLRAELAAGRSVVETADFLCRAPEEIKRRMDALGVSVRFFTRGGAIKTE